MHQSQRTQPRAEAYHELQLHKEGGDFAKLLSYHNIGEIEVPPTDELMDKCCQVWSKQSVQLIGLRVISRQDPKELQPNWLNMYRGEQPQ